MWGDKKRKRAVAMVGVVVGVFAVCWLPIHVFHLWNRFDENFPYVESTYIYKIVAHTLSYANCCINPFIYGCLGDGFRKGMRKALPCAQYRQCQSTVNPCSNSRRKKGIYSGRESGSHKRHSTAACTLSKARTSAYSVKRSST